MSNNFFGNSFIFNGIASEMFDLRIYDFSPSNPSSGILAEDVEIKEEWLYRREVPYFYGRYYENSLEFDFTVGSYSFIDAKKRHAIEAWLTGKPTYLPLRIVQDDMTDVVFNAIIKKTTPLYVGNLNYALTLHAKCDRPWGVYYPPDTRVTFSTGSYVTQTFDYVNTSVYAGYNKPTIIFTMDTAYGDSFSLINNTDGGREFRFEGLSDGEQITVDNDKGIITSSNASLRLGNFNKNFFRLLQGVNSLTISGYISDFTISSVFARGVGV